MAVELGSKIVKDTEQFASYAIGITLPLSFGESTFQQSYLTKDQIKSNIQNLLLTKKGERVLQPEFGSGLSELLFEQNVDGLEQKIEDAINSSLEQWLPYVTAEEITIESTNELKDRNRINVSISFRVGDTTNLETLTFSVGE
jgi:phage baseplate assembly protein W